MLREGVKLANIEATIVAPASFASNELSTKSKRMRQSCGKLKPQLKLPLYRLVDHRTAYGPTIRLRHIA